MQPYKFKVRHIPGPKNIADTLSRLVKNTDAKVKSDEAEMFVRSIAKESTPKAMAIKDIERESERDHTLEMLRDSVKTGDWNSPELKSYLPVKNELCVVGKLILRGSRIVLPRTLWKQALEIAHEGHIGIVSMKQHLRTKVWWPGIDRQVESYCKSCHGCQIVSTSCPPEPMIRTSLPTGPWQHLAADLLGPLPSGDNIFVVV